MQSSVHWHGPQVDFLQWDQWTGTSTFPTTSWRRLSTSSIHDLRSPFWTRWIRSSQARPSSTAVIVTTL